MRHITGALQNLAALFRQVAREELLHRHGRLRADQIHQHSDGSFFTEADLISEKRLIEGAVSLFPDAIVTGEEEISEDPYPFFARAQDKTVVIFDPIDGTGAFKRGEDRYGMLGAVIKNGQTVGGVIYTPGHGVADESGILQPEKDIMIIAEKGRGCWMYEKGDKKNAVRLSLSGRPLSLKDHAKIAFACRNQDAVYHDILAQDVAGYMPCGNASHDYTMILTGACDAAFYSEGFVNDSIGRSPPWDHAAGILAIQEAGGYAGLPYHGRDGVPYTPLACHDRLLVASTKTLFQSVYSHIAARAPALTKPRL